ncbi:MAG: hypothetical protein Q9212_000387 [Teloschistes hypoglaucus]
MPSQPAIPPLLSTQFCNSQIQGSLVFLTSVLNASTNWVLLRHVYSALKGQPSPSTEPVDGTAVLFISWLHGSDIWRDGARKLGFNFPDDGKITFIDALHLGHGLRKDGINEVEDVLLKKIKEVETSKNRVLLILDGIDFLLAATEARLDEILGMIWELRERVHASIVSMSANYPLLQSRHTSLEINHTALLMSLAHQARTIWAVKELDTGSARDVSGVLRISRGPAAEDDDQAEGDRQDEKESLFFVAADGGVRVFERGSS